MIDSLKGKTLEVFLLIMISFSPLFGTSQIIVLVFLLILLNMTLVKKLNKKKFLLLFIFMMLFMLATLLDMKNITRMSEVSALNGYYPLTFLLGFIISSKYTLNEYLYYLEKIIYWATLASLIGVFLYTFYPSAIYKLPSYNYYHTTHKTAYIFNVILTDSGILSRNAGIAWEPGAFQFLINTGLYTHIKLNSKFKIRKILIYSIALFTTGSTAGFLIYMLIIIEIVKKDKKIIFLFGIGLLLFSNEIYNEFIYQNQYKLFGSNAFELRLIPTLNAFNIGTNQLFGLGNSGYNKYYESLGIGAWDSFGQIFIRYGYPLFILINYLIYKIFKKDSILAMIIIITFLSQGIWFAPIMTPLYFMSIDNEDKFKDVLLNK